MRRIWTTRDDKKANEFYERMAKMPMPQHIYDMRNFYREHGYYQTKDLVRVLGHPCGHVEWPMTDEQLRKHFIRNPQAA